jgi:hypothetical protein
VTGQNSVRAKPNIQADATLFGAAMTKDDIRSNDRVIDLAISCGALF